MAAAAAGAVALMRTRPRTRSGRTLQLAGVGARVGVTEASFRARRLFASAERSDELDRRRELRTAEQVTEALGSMRGVLMKAGQLASYLDSSLPETLRDHLATLQQDAPPMAPELVAQVVEAELGAGPDRVFLEWDAVPMAAASIGQVHRAITTDERAVAVKVQYPGVDEAIGADLDNTEVLVRLVSLAFPALEAAPLVEELRSRFFEELDYRQEAKNQRLFVSLYEGHPFIRIPAVVDELSTERVLTTELAAGARFAEATTWPQDERDLAGEAIYRFVFRSINRYRLFNGDPHPGNYLFHGGGQVTFVDFGLVKQYTEAELDLFHSMIRHMVLDPDPPAFRRAVERGGVLRAGAPASDEQVVDYFGNFYKLLLDETAHAVSHEYAAEIVQRTLGLDLESRAVSKWANVPPAFVFNQRLNLGLYSLLAELGSVAPWRRIAEELWPFVDGSPSTELGHEEAAWLRRR